MKSVIITAIMFASLSAMAQGTSVCDLQIQLSDSQKSAIQIIRQNAENKINALKIELNKAKLEMHQTLINENSVEADAETAYETLKSKKAEIAQVKESSKIAILFDVLTPVQRVNKVKCEKTHRDAERRTHQYPGYYYPRYPRYTYPTNPYYRPYRPHGCQRHCGSWVHP